MHRNDPSADVLSRLHQALDVRNSQGLRSSFDLQSNEWVEFSDSQTPLCPHVLNKYHNEDECRMKFHHDGTKSYWKAKTHPCNFIETVRKPYVAVNNRHIFHELLP
ncbi:hypothetical protein ARMSODRAFT_1016788 [Armillaria solidipes]|uniref:Uncharacterized protein n=1 Tax=Armillaria solidipes TaxID=1076256 RepID=A0A2H3BXT7_9AGAR|nr:hypothetical protein ARMSODRAFT_1016788 [Armillaria solidipes]